MYKELEAPIRNKNKTHSHTHKKKKQSNKINLSGYGFLIWSQFDSDIYAQPCQSSYLFSVFSRKKQNIKTEVNSLKLSICCIS